MEEKLASVQEVSDEVQALVRLKGVVEFHDEWVSDLLHDVALNLHLIGLIGPNYEVFLKGLDRVDL